MLTQHTNERTVPESLLLAFVTALGEMRATIESIVCTAITSERTWR